MAITSRAARTTHFSSFNTPAVVGPGSYMRIDSDPTVHGYAPFSSTVERPAPNSASTSQATPGPGSYVTPLENTLGRTPFAPNSMPAGAGASFASKVARMPKPVSSAQPGPGQYQLHDSWQHVGSQSLAGGAGRRVVAKVRPAGPPSIPVAEQSFGYEEVGDGELRLQQPPHSGYTGKSGHRSAGPGEYEPTRSTPLTKPATLEPSFGNSRVMRAVFAESADTPGPGSYSSQNVELHQKPSATFISRVPLAYQKLIDPEQLVPGPGSYNSVGSIKPTSVPENLQAFGSTQKRLSSDAMTPSERQRMAQPGPGAYEERRNLFGGNSDSRAPLTGPMIGAMSDMLNASGTERPARSGFNSSTVRFTRLSTTSKPGPGHYDANDQQSFVAALGRKTHGRNGVFGSTTRRFHTLKQDPVPGAGSYNPVVAGANEAERDEGPSSAFASAVQRFSKSAPTRISSKLGRDKDAVPPPWQYDVHSANAWERVPAHKGVAACRQNRTFLSSVERFPAGELGGGARILPGPGPGQYAPKHPDDSFRKQQTTAMCFGTKEDRFEGPRGVFSGVAPTPGPGQYESTVELTDPMVKRSFNITIG